MNFLAKDITRLRYSIREDLALLKEVNFTNPFEDVSRWDEIHLNFTEALGKPFSKRSIKEHVEHLLKLYVKEDTFNLRKSGSEEEYLEKEQLLKEIKELAENAERKSYDERLRRKTQRQTDRKNSDIIISNIFSCVKSELGDSVMQTAKTQDLSGTSECNESSSEPSTADPNSCSPVLRGHKRKRIKNPMLDFLERKLVMEKELKERELELQKRDLELQERKLKLDEERLEFEVKKFNLEEEERKARLKMLDVVQNIEVEKHKVEMRKFDLEEEERKTKLKTSEFTPSVLCKLMEIINQKS